MEDSDEGIYATVSEMLWLAEQVAAKEETLTASVTNQKGGSEKRTDDVKDMSSSMSCSSDRTVHETFLANYTKLAVWSAKIVITEPYTSSTTLGSTRFNHDSRLCEAEGFPNFFVGLSNKIVELNRLQQQVWNQYANIYASKYEKLDSKKDAEDQTENELKERMHQSDYHILASWPEGKAGFGARHPERWVTRKQEVDKEERLQKLKQLFVEKNVDTSTATAM